MILIVFLQGEKIILRFWQSKVCVAASARELVAGLDKLLKKEKAGVNGIKGVVAIFGQATFTSSRQMAVALNTLAFVLKIKIVSLVSEEGDKEGIVKKGVELLKSRKAGIFIKPYYNRPPNITVAKKFLAYESKN